MPSPRTRTERRSRWRELKRREVLEAAVRLVRSDGLEALTMERVADSAGVAKGTVYLYFESKRRLVESVIERILEPLVEEVCRLLDSEAAPEERLRRMAEANLTYFDRHRPVFRVFIHGRYASRNHVQRARDGYYRRILAGTTGVIRQGIAEGRFRAVDPETTAAIWIEALTVVLVRRLQAPVPGSTDAATDSLLRLFFDGLVRSDPD